MEKGEKKNKPKGIQEGPPIWVETLLTAEEWKENLKKYPGTCHLGVPPTFFKSDYEWRYNMGGTLPAVEIDRISKRLDHMLKTVKNEQTV